MRRIYPIPLFSFPVLFFILISHYTFSQSAAIKGKVIGLNPSDAPVVNLLAAKDSMMIKATICESDGKFEFDLLKPGNYLINITQLGYSNYVSTAISITDAKQQVQLPDITLSRSSTELKEVEVTTRKPFVQRKIDRMIVNPDALISNTGTTALEVLEKSPGVLVDADGNISLKGKPGVMVFIDDKPTYMSSAELAAYLRSLPSGAIESIEIMTTPPAKYEAAGNAGIINIKLKRTTEKGFNGGINLNYGQGRYMRTNNSLNFNCNIRKVNIFSNISWSRNGSYQDLTINRYYYTPSGDYSSAFSQNSYIHPTNQGRTARIGMDYYASKKSTLGMVFSGFLNSTDMHMTNNAQASDANNQTVLIVEARTPSKRELMNGSVNLNYSYKPDDKGKELTTNVDYIVYDAKQSQQLINSNFTPDHVLINQTILQSFLPSNIAIGSAKVDYTYPLANAAKLEAGAKTSLVTTDNTADFYDVINDVSTPNYEFSNRFKYKENIYAAYLNYSEEWKKISMQLGMRVENTSIHGNQLGNPVVSDSSFQVNYTSGFPTFYLSYKVDSAQKNQFGFSFGRRINRPNYEDLNPFTYPFDKYTYYGGNPFLKPTFSYNFELSHTYKNFLTTTFEYSVATNLIDETNEQRGTIYYSRPGNFGEQSVYGVSVNGNFTISKWWNLQLYTECKNIAVHSTMYGQNINAQRWYWYVGPTNQFTVTKNLSAEWGGNYITKVRSGQFLTISAWQTRIGCSYKFLKGNATVKLNLNDALYTQRAGGDILNVTNSRANWRSRFDSRVIVIGFSYRFNKGKAFQARQAGGADTEKERVKTS